MCWALYAASDRELPVIAWDNSAPAFYTSQIDEHDSAIKSQFSLSNIVYLGSHEGCGCGFFNDEEPQDQAISCSTLAEYLTRARSSGAAVEVFLCWEGGQGNPASSRIRLSPADFSSHPFPLAEDGFASII